MRVLKKALALILAYGVEGLCIVLLTVISIDLLLGVFSRYVLERTFVWYDEVARACFIWLVFLGAAAAVKRGAHFGLHIVRRCNAAASQARGFAPDAADGDRLLRACSSCRAGT